MSAPGVVAVVGDDGVGRCPWGAGSELLGEYHDREWGRVLHGRDALYERISLEAFQSGLSWLIVLRKRPAFREAFAGFDPEAVARFDETDTARLLADAGIVRNRAKIEATIDNAQAYLRLRERTSLRKLLWDHLGKDGPVQNRVRSMRDIPAETELSKRISKALKAEGFRFVGPTTIYAFMQSSGMVNDHLVDCFRYGECAKLQKANVRA